YCQKAGEDKPFRVFPHSGRGCRSPHSLGHPAPSTRPEPGQDMRRVVLLSVWSPSHRKPLPNAPSRSPPNPAACAWERHPPENSGGALPWLVCPPKGFSRAAGTPNQAFVPVRESTVSELPKKDQATLGFPDTEKTRSICEE